MITLRKLTTYTLETTVKPVTLRDIKAFVLIGPLNRPTWSVPGYAGLLAGINKEQGTSLTATDVSLLTSVLTGDASFNAAVLVTAKSPGKYKDSFTFRYTRFDLSEAFASQSLTLPPGTFADVHAALTEINDMFSVALETTDVVNQTLAPDYTSIPLIVDTHSAYYIPGTQVILGTP